MSPQDHLPLGPDGSGPYRKDRPPRKDARGRRPARPPDPPTPDPVPPAALPIPVEIGDILHCVAEHRTHAMHVAGLGPDGAPIVREMTWGRLGMDTRLDRRHLEALVSITRDGRQIYPAPQEETP